MSTTVDGDQPRRWLTLVAMTGSLSMIFTDITVVGVALPQIQRDLGMSDVSIQWVMSVYVLVMACLVALCGRLADLIGRVPAFVAGVSLFTLASVACGFAGSAAALIAARAVQGAGAAIMQPASGAIVVSAFAPGSRGKAMGIYVGISLLFMVIGPLIGGVITQALSWRWCFWINVPIAVTALVMTAVARPADRRSASRRVDPAAVALLLIGLPAFVLGVQQGPVWGWRHPWIAPLVVGGAVLLAFFVRSQWRSREPLLALGLFRDRGLLANALILFFMQFAMTGLLIHGSVYAQTVLEYDPRQAGASLLPLLLPTIFVVHVAGRMYDRIGVAAPAMIGTVLATIGGAVAGVGSLLQEYLIIATGFAVMGTGIGFVLSPTNTDSLSRVPADMRAQVSGLMQTMRHVGGVVGLAVIGAVILWRRGGLDAAHVAARDATAASIAAGYWAGTAALGAAACIAAALHRPAPAKRGGRGVTESVPHDAPHRRPEAGAS